MRCVRCTGLRNPELFGNPHTSHTPECHGYNGGLFGHFPPKSTNSQKNFFENKPCMHSLRLVWHYSHHCQDLAEFRASLSILRKHSLGSEIMVIEDIHPPVSSSTTTTIYMISNSNIPFISSPMEDPLDLS